MKIDIIHPAHYRDDGTLVQSKKWIDRLGAYVPHLGPSLIAALTPDRHEVRLKDEYLEDIDFESDADVVAISAQIMHFDRCKDIAKEFRSRGKITVLGGYLPSLVPEKVKGLFDTIVIGEGDEIWPQILNDIERGQIKDSYQQNELSDISNLPVPRYDLIKKDRIVVYPVQATRGCPFQCDFCSIAAVYNGDYRKRPVEHIIRDIEATGSRNINFCDDNLCEDIEFSERLFTAMAGSKIRWGTQTTINVANYPNLLKKAGESGATLLALGVETFSMKNLEEVNKTFYAVDKYAEGFQRIRDAGITPHALIIFGLPDDNGETFKTTVDYLENLKVPIGQFFLLMPYPGTSFGDKIQQEGRLIDNQLSHFREPYVVYHPEHLAPDELREGWWSALKRFYSLRSIFKRIVMQRKVNHFWVNMATNLSYWLKIKRGIHPVYFGL
ncbi:MAG: B12-binding domain-containing radical SAM protein [Candidatus Aminicenantes bacterium]|nr:MAG: B12-binding domain-containing radical SAM protein [Candidatus Aminicenantes bacterium]